MTFAKLGNAARRLLCIVELGVWLKDKARAFMVKMVEDRRIPQ